VTEAQCAEACVAGGWDWYIWEPDGNCTYNGTEWYCELPELKWDQPPVHAVPDNVSYGWNEFSSCCHRTVADDWYCDTPYPVTGVHWWGTFDGWRETYPPPEPFDHFHIFIWTDVPAGSGEPFSHPGVVIHEIFAFDYDWTFVGWTYDPMMEDFEAVFRFDYSLDSLEYFHQEDGNNIYWLNVNAGYCGLEPGPNPWGWLTRPRADNSAAPDAAVIMPNPNQLYTPPGTTWDEIGGGYPIYWPDPEHSWDMAFGLTTDMSPDPLKWSQPPYAYVPENAFNGWDELSVYGDAWDLQIAADDWRCTSEMPVTGVDFWGSFIGWGEPYPPASTRPLAFHLAVWTDVPAGVNADFSHPGYVLWEALCEEESIEFAGWDFDPRDPEAPPEACFKFECDLNDNEWFYQGTGENIYWMSISAVYPGGAVAEYPWGWTTRPRDPDSAAPDDAVRLFDPTAPTADPPSVYIEGEPLYWPTPEDSWDLAFQLTTEHPLEPKWTQPPHGGGEGFDAPSDLWLHQLYSICPFLQEPDQYLPGLNAHDWDYGDGYHWLTLADAWACGSGDVIELSWYGNYELDALQEEMRGSGINEFRLSLHEHVPVPPVCLPGDEIWAMTVSFDELIEQPTGIYNIEGSMIYRYVTDVPYPRPYVQDTVYYLDVEAHAVEPTNPALWRWQEAGREMFPDLCAAARRFDGGQWEPILWPDDTYSDMAFGVIVTDHEVNKVVADDFISDGRPIEALRWWGSYWDDMYSPDYPYEPGPYVLDGWIISFHYSDPDEPCPPENTAGDIPSALGLYFAPVDAVTIMGLDMGDCFGHGVYEYVVDLSRCCLLCSQSDPRNGSQPAQQEAFWETLGFRYWLDIQAVTGATWSTAVEPSCEMVYTDHLPSPNTPDGHFWGWHTSPANSEPQGPGEEACTGRVIDFGLTPYDCWDYGNWEKQPWLCDEMPPFPPVHMAFELMTTAPGCPWDVSNNGVVDPVDVGIVKQHYGCPVGTGDPACDQCDFSGNGTVDLVDVGIVKQHYGPCPYP